ncbi:metallophosphoesterase [Stackebrandtia nassauensis]|uniref:Metallophosphoesterase n=1 Tax=Stackebrandtia nassauensis (strain DSM 44728 / CIP 108903 / NRRL B-16338 / NBRC 102104 / LLR-40K-21) TaxID=446470 RepID=D3Q2J9_STANL|nr:metallophosphoesterase [Stackebrandtia nassauensis]ADD43932.1 metallophosphoesterase [Stackebrandtia nassauensis DSM 44728]
MPERRKFGPRLLATATVVVIAATALAASQSFANETSPPDKKSPDVPALAEQVTQVREPGTKQAATSVSGRGAAATGSRSICAEDARWLRIRFTKLDLRGDDTIRLRGSSGGSLKLDADNWPGKAFHTRALPGSCVTVTPDLSDADSRFAVDAYQYGEQPLSQASVTVAGAGDICGSACNQTDDLIANINPAAVFTAGDNAYESGTLSQYRNQYDPTWGRFKSKTHPTPGNHEYQTSGASGYFDYFNGTGNNTGPAGERGKGYYSYDVGDWHFVALNSDISHGAGSTQEKWLRADLAANTKPCTAAYTHHPRFSSGDHGDDTGMTALYDALYANKADIFVTGHDHHYERFAPARSNGAEDPNGVRAFVIGTGGRNLYSSTSNSAGPSEKFNNNTFGVGKFQLTATGYTMDFVPVAGRTFTDHVEGECHNAAKTPDFGVTANPSALSLPQGTSAETTATVASSGGFGSAVALSASGLPSGVTAAFSPATVTPPANGQATSRLTFTAASTAAIGSHTVTVTAKSGDTSRTFAVTVTVRDPNDAGLSDDFEAERGWVVNPAGTDTAATGIWERGDPDQTTSTYSDQVKQLGTTASGSNALSTGRAAGSAYGDNDLDGGVTSVRSPAFTVPSGTAGLSFAYNVAHGDNSSADDYLRVSVVDASGTTKVWESLGAASEKAGSWKTATVDLSRYAGKEVTILVQAADAGGGSLFEAQLDDVTVS